MILKQAQLLQLETAIEIGIGWVETLNCKVNWQKRRLGMVLAMTADWQKEVGI